MKPHPQFQFLLYVADHSHTSALAVANLRALCDAHLPGCHAIEVVDVFQQRARALADHVFITPLLIRLAPGPVRRIVGTLSQPEKVLHALGLEPIAA